MAGWSLEKIRAFRCYSGHFGPSFSDLLGRPLPTITYLRDPLERAVSLIHFILREVTQFPDQESADLVHSIKASSHPFEAFVETAAHLPGVRDGQCCELTHRWPLQRYLTPEGNFSPNLATFWNEGVYPPGDRLLEEARAYFDSLPAFGIAEYPEESLHYITEVLGLPRNEPLRWERLAPERQNRWQPFYWKETLPPDIRRKLAGLLEADQELYRHALNRFQSERAQRTSTTSPRLPG